MALTAAQIQTEVGRSLTPIEFDQVELWVDDCKRQIAKRFGSLDALDPGAVDQVVRQAVARRVKRPDDITQSSVTIDGDTLQRTYQASRGTIEIWDEEWDLLTSQPQSARTSGAGSVKLAYTPDQRPGLDRHDW